MGNSSGVLHEYRSNLCKKGKYLLDEFVEACSEMTDADRSAAIKAKLDQLAIEHPLPSICFIQFEKLKELNTFPRCPENSSLTTTVEEIDRDNSFLVFISHCWMRGYSGAEGWDGRPHPDNVAGDKYALCVTGIELLKKVVAPRMKNCYVWLDFGCINQDRDPAGELEQLDDIVQMCDCIFTPIVDHHHKSWTIPQSFHSYFEEYKAPLWNHGPHAYLNRGWCRVEMLYAANIPVRENANSEVKRHTMFEAGLAYHCSQNRRPHFLYGTKEFEGVDVVPLQLPPLQYSYLTDFHPLKGNLSVATDVDHIKSLIAVLQPYLDANKIVLGYKGEVNAVGQKHGHGVYRFDSGAVYEGEWSDGNMNGQGVYRYPDGGTYEGHWKDDKKHGHGVYHYTDGSVYEGHFEEGHMHGHGTMRSADGGVYKGELKNGKKHGHGINRYATGDVYEGEWRDDKKHGHGIYVYADGRMYEGSFVHGVMHGKGVYRTAGGEIYEESVTPTNAHNESEHSEAPH